MRLKVDVGIGFVRSLASPGGNITGLYVHVQRPGDAGTKREMAWAAYEKITVRRKEASRG